MTGRASGGTNLRDAGIVSGRSPARTGVDIHPAGAGQTRVRMLDPMETADGVVALEVNLLGCVGTVEVVYVLMGTVVDRPIVKHGTRHGHRRPLCTFCLFDLKQDVSKTNL
jgi:hypothetical protein